MRLETHLVEEYVALEVRDAARTLEAVPPSSTAALLLGLAARSRAALVGCLPAGYVARCLESLGADQGASLLVGARHDVAAAALRWLNDDARHALIDKLPASVRAPLERVLHYPASVAGAFMDPHILTVDEDRTAGEAMERLRSEPEHVLYYVYIVDDDQKLVGVLNLRELLLARPEERVGDVASRHVDAIPALASWESVLAHPAWGRVHALPVVEDGRFVGALRYESIRDLEQRAIEQAARDPAPRTGAALAELYGLGLRGLFAWGSLTVHDPRSRRGPGLEP